MSIGIGFTLQYHCVEMQPVDFKRKAFIFLVLNPVKRYKDLIEGVASELHPYAEKVESVFWIFLSLRKNI